MPLLLIPPLLVAAIALALLLALLLYPFGLVQRYRAGRARRRLRPWLASLNAWLLAASTLLFLLGAWIGGHWVAHALRAATLGLALGAVVGGFGFLVTRFEQAADGTWYTPNRWLVLALTALLAARLALGLWQAWRPAGEASALATLLADHAQLFGLGGLLLGYAVSYAWLLRARSRR